MYADDINLTVSSVNIDSVVESLDASIFQEINCLANCNLLLNFDKTNYLEFSCRKEGLK